VNELGRIIFLSRVSCRDALNIEIDWALGTDLVSASIVSFSFNIILQFQNGHSKHEASMFSFSHDLSGLRGLTTL
jgi:hypothetical protein